jgi:signal transduction histidine kinase
MPEKQAMAAAQVIADVRDDLARTADERGVRFEITNAPAVLWLAGDRLQVRHALAAVVRNAVEAAGHDGWVRMGCEAAGDAIRLTVEDSGPGLSAEAAEHAFDPFFSGRSAGRGRGLGLSTGWRLVRQNGGDIRYEPTPDGVARFVLTLPVAAVDVVSIDRVCA